MLKLNSDNIFTSFVADEIAVFFPINITDCYLKERLEYYQLLDYLVSISFPICVNRFLPTFNSHFKQIFITVV